jgi:hypothetical protein
MDSDPAIFKNYGTDPDPGGLKTFESGTLTSGVSLSFMKPWT